MYELPSFGYHYFEGVALDKAVVIAVGSSGVRLHDAADADRAVVAEYDFDNVESFTCPSEVGGVLIIAGGVRGTGRIWILFAYWASISIAVAA